MVVVKILICLKMLTVYQLKRLENSIHSKCEIYKSVPSHKLSTKSTPTRT